jgi:SAM-dependent methyltransferase
MGHLMSSHFEEALRRSMPDSFEEPIGDYWIQYILDTNKRGQFVASKLSDFLDSLDSKRHLDIGSGYGGTCIAVAMAGAVSEGVELDPTLIELAQANLADQPEGLQVTFHQGDILDTATCSSLSLYHVITCDNVIEHVVDPERLAFVISGLLEEGGIAYITIPNGYSIDQVLRDSHYKQFAITLLEPAMAREYHDIAIGYGVYDVWYYLTFQQYTTIFTRYGLIPSLINPLDTSPERIMTICDETAKTFDEGLMNIDQRLPKKLKKKIHKRIGDYVHELERECRQYREAKTPIERKDIAARISRDRLVERWDIILEKSSGAVDQLPI